MKCPNCGDGMRADSFRLGLGYCSNEACRLYAVERYEQYLKVSWWERWTVSGSSAVGAVEMPEVYRVSESWLLVGLKEKQR